MHANEIPPLLLLLHLLGEMEQARRRAGVGASSRHWRRARILVQRAGSRRINLARLALAV